MYIPDYLMQRMKQENVNPYSLQKNSWINKLITYMIDSRKRQSVLLQPWINKQVKGFPTESVWNKYDDIVLSKLRQVKREVKYVPDYIQWGPREYWATVPEILEIGKDDCDGGATLLYYYLRSIGIPDDRLMIFAGDVIDPYDKDKTAGHCWLGYKPDNYPFHWVFLDWCYYTDYTPIHSRIKYMIHENKIYNVGSDCWKNLKTKYKTTWFGFNASASYIEINHTTWGDGVGR